MADCPCTNMQEAHIKLILYVGLGLTQELEEIVDLEDFKTHFDSTYVDERTVTLPLWNLLLFMRTHRKMVT